MRPIFIRCLHTQQNLWPDKRGKTNEPIYSHRSRLSHLKGKNYRRFGAKIDFFPAIYSISTIFVRSPEGLGEKRKLKQYSWICGEIIVTPLANHWSHRTLGIDFTNTSFFSWETWPSHWSSDEPLFTTHYQFSSELIFDAFRCTLQFPWNQSTTCHFNFCSLLFIQAAFVLSFLALWLEVHIDTVLYVDIQIISSKMESCPMHEVNVHIWAIGVREGNRRMKLKTHLSTNVIHAFRRRLLRFEGGGGGGVGPFDPMDHNRRTHNFTLTRIVNMKFIYDALISATKNDH